MRRLLTILFAAMVAIAPVAGEAAGRVETQLWNSIRDSRNPDDFAYYLSRYPHGEWAPQAERKLVRLERKERRAAAEDRLGLTRGQKLEVEERLARAGHYPGSINGVFDGDTRFAIADYRRSAGLPASNYLDTRMLRALVRDTDYAYRGSQHRETRDGEIAAGVVAGALILGGVILLAD